MEKINYIPLGSIVLLSRYSGNHCRNHCNYYGYDNYHKSCCQ